VNPAFVGTDTGVGKTAAAVAFSRHLANCGDDVPVVKLYVSGEENGRWSDLDAGGLSEEWWTPARYRRPLSPLGAVRLGETLVPVARVRSYLVEIRRRFPRHIIEGIGGVLVPLEPDLRWIDLHAEESWPAVLVARGGLGTINHSLLTIEALRRRSIPILGLAISAPSSGARDEAAENAAIIHQFTGIEPLGIVDYDPADPISAWERGIEWSKLERYLGER
jgi:dethiobiotin synthase